MIKTLSILLVSVLFFSCPTELIAQTNNGTGVHQTDSSNSSNNTTANHPTTPITPNSSLNNKCTKIIYKDDGSTAIKIPVTYTCTQTFKSNVFSSTYTVKDPAGTVIGTITMEHNKTTKKITVTVLNQKNKLVFNQLINDVVASDNSISGIVDDKTVPEQNDKTYQLKYESSAKEYVLPISIFGEYQNDETTYFTFPF